MPIRIFWTENTKDNIRRLAINLYRQSRFELKMFKKTNDRTYLLQAGEKAYNIVTQIANYELMKKNLNKTRTHEDTRRFYSQHKIKSLKNETLKKLIKFGNHLHYNFYNNEAPSNVLVRKTEYILDTAKRYLNL